MFVDSSVWSTNPNSEVRFNIISWPILKMVPWLRNFIQNCRWLKKHWGNASNFRVQSVSTNDIATIAAGHLYIQFVSLISMESVLQWNFYFGLVWDSPTNIRHEHVELCQESESFWNEIKKKTAVTFDDGCSSLRSLQSARQSDYKIIKWSDWMTWTANAVITRHKNNTLLNAVIRWRIQNIY